MPAKTDPRAADRLIAIVSVCITAVSLLSAVYFGVNASFRDEVAQRRALISDYTLRAQAYDLAVALPTDSERLAALKRLRDILEEDKKQGFALFEGLFAEVESRVGETEEEIRRKELAKQREAELAAAEINAKADADAAALVLRLQEEQLLATQQAEQARAEEARQAEDREAARRRAEERAFKYDERVCFDDACRNWIIR